MSHSETSACSHLQPVSYETRPWPRDPDALEGIPKSRRRAIAPTYQAAVPARIAHLELALPPRLAERLTEIMVELARFDATQASRGYNLPALLLRSESSASSQIENLTSSVRNVALAEVSGDAPHNARLIAGNVAAMRAALDLPEELTPAGIQLIHRTLIEPTGESFGGEFRTEQVWVGGTAYSPHGALFVPPHVDRLHDCIDDLVLFANREGINPVAKAAIVHAQFETIHPFIDGNGRTGRTLLHKILKREGILQQATLPISAGLLHNTESYMESIRAYQHGDPIAIIERVTDVLEVALVVGALAAQEIDNVLEAWRASITERKGSSMFRLPSVLVEQPVVDAKYLANALGITPRATNNLIDRAIEYGMLRPIGNARRGTFYQADELISVLEQLSDLQAMRRVLATGKL